MTITAAAMLSACATRPESISASYISHEKYTHLDCVGLSTKIADARSELQKYSDLQDTKANTDAVTVFFVLVPASQLAGDHEADVTKWKGEVEALETAQIKNQCKSS